MKIHLSVGLIVAAIVASASAQIATPSAPAPPTSRAEDKLPTGSAYRLGPDDQLVIHALDVPDISEKTQRIDTNGDLRLPLVGRIHAAGLTPSQLESLLVERLKVYLNDPDVSVTMTESKSQPFTIVGAVATPGVRQLEGRKNLIEVLSIAGGPSQDAGPVVRVTRHLDQGRIPLPDATDNLDTGFSVVDIPLKPLLDANTPEKNIAIRPNDLISIPRAELVYVVGEVGKVGSVPVTRGSSITVVEVISASGGMLRTAASGSARILRSQPGSQQRTEIPVNVGNIMQGKSNDIPLYPGDILVVPDSKGKRATTRALESALQLGLLVASYGIIH